MQDTNLIRSLYVGLASSGFSPARQGRLDLLSAEKIVYQLTEFGDPGGIQESDHWFSTGHWGDVTAGVLKPGERASYFDGVKYIFVFYCLWFEKL